MKAVARVLLGLIGATVILMMTATSFDMTEIETLVLLSVWLVIVEAAVKHSTVRPSDNDGNVPLAVAIALASLIFIAPCRTRAKYEDRPVFAAGYAKLYAAHPGSL